MSGMNGLPNGVSWKAVFVVLLPVMLAPVAVSWALIESHSAQPHREAVHVREFDRMYDDLQQIKDDIRSIRDELRNRKSP